MATTTSKRIGFLADTHSMKRDGTDLPDAVLKAFKGVDTIVHLGDIGQKGILERLGEVAPVLVPVGGNKGYVPHTDRTAPPVFVLDAPTAVVGLAFNLAQPDKKITVGETLTFPDEPLEKLFKRRFKQERVDVVAYGGTHAHAEQWHENILFFNPGSPTLPVPGKPASVAVLDLKAKKPKVAFATWR